MLSRLDCIRDAGMSNAKTCLGTMKWSDLDDTEVKVSPRLMTHHGGGVS